MNNHDISTTAKRVLAEAEVLLRPASGANFNWKDERAI